MKPTQKYFVKLLEALITNFRDVLVSSDGMGTLIRPTVSKRKGEKCLAENLLKIVFKERNTVSFRTLKLVVSPLWIHSGCTTEEHISASCALWSPSTLLTWANKKWTTALNFLLAYTKTKHHLFSPILFLQDITGRLTFYCELCCRHVWSHTEGDSANVLLCHLP